MQPDERARSVRAGAGDPLVGRLLDRRYRIGARIARGGMASVYEATDIRLDRVVAVKVMHPGLGDDDEFAARFVREARAAARLSHPNVVGVFDQGEEDGVVFLAMELVSGHTLRDVIRKEAPMSPSRALALLEPVLSALAAAHRAGLIHRDIKPENVLIADDGRVKVADFGLAKAVSTDTQHTATGGVLIGTVSYLAPELVVDGRADARADVYAAGVVMYELLTGHKPHEGESPIQVAYKHVHEDVPAPSVLVPGLPAYVDALVARATARDRGQRPADAAVLLHQLHRVAQALAAGVPEDPELVADLMPIRGAALDLPDLEDAPEWLDTSDLAEVRAAPAEHPTTSVVPVPVSPHTTSIEPHASMAPGPRGRIDRLPAPRPDVRPAAGTPRRSRRGPVTLVLALLLVGVLAAGAWWFGSARYTTTPGVLGLEQAAAEAQLGKAGLDAQVTDPAYSESIPAGQVLATDPKPGDRVLDGGTVTLVLSAGPERYSVPELQGRTLDQAQDALLATNLAFGKAVERYSETVPEGVVMASDPVVGTALKRDASVNVVVSKGRKPLTIKDWTGKPADRAEQAMEKRGLVVDRQQEQFSATVPAGAVISQNPTTGTLFKGETVTLVVSKGPELIEVPQVVAMGVEAATERLQELGFQVQVEHSDSYIGVGFVFSSDPGAGEMVAKGSTITLYLV
ncbi:Stk1 family PASTA domain-containing Ser/Thr kinase [Nocardioides sp. LHG3406-4]|uniref:Stk1 family PASTA domain-containing Ser/Thr kinase n=1 Tax=Nocardioides sp. LHG3406-4 TaxID=2804575 RepID=UPI003CEDD4D4